MTQPTEKKFFRPKEAAAFIGCSKRTIDNYAVRGLLTRKKIAGSNATFFDRDQLAALPR